MCRGRARRAVAALSPRTRRAVATLLVPLSLVPPATGAPAIEAPVVAGPESAADTSCFWRATHDWVEGRRIEIVLRHGNRYRGRFVDDPSVSEIRFVPSGAGRSPITVPFSEVSEMSVQKWRPIRPLYPLAGALAGGFIGAFIEGASFPGARESAATELPNLGLALFPAAGAAIGFLTGVGLALKTPGMERVPCSGHEEPLRPRARRGRE